MCNEAKYNGQTSYPQDQLGYTTRYGSAIEKFINEAADKHLSNADGFRNSLGGGSGAKDLANALAGFAYAATAPRHEWSFTVNYYYDIPMFAGGTAAVAEGMIDEINGVKFFECWPRPEEVGYVHDLDEIGLTQIWMSGSTDGALVLDGKPYEEYHIGYRQHWCINEGGYNLTVSTVGVLSLFNGDVKLYWFPLDSDLTPVHVSMTIQFDDGSWVHQRDIALRPLPTPHGERNGVSLNPGKKIVRLHVHAVLRASVSD